MKTKETIKTKDGIKRTYRLKKNGKKVVGNEGKKNEKILTELEELFMVDCNITEACSQVGISLQTYYRWIEEDPKIGERMKKAQERPLTFAKKKHMLLMNCGNPKIESTHTLEHLKNRSNDWKTKSEVKVEGDIKTTTTLSDEDRDLLDEIFDELGID